MSCEEKFEMLPHLIHDEECAWARESFSSYLDGDMSGVDMAALSDHLELCGDCAMEFAAWRDVQSALAQVGSAHAPMRLQAQLRAAIAAEFARGAHLPWTGRLRMAWDRTLGPLAVRVSGGLALAMLLVVGLGWMFAVPIAVQADDDGLADLRAPRYLYSQVPPQPIATDHDVPLVVEAKVDAAGRVYDYTVLAGPGDDQRVKLQLEQNLLASVFRPATVFGVPVPGHVVLTYAGVSVHG
ncbi:anti-sigma factor [Granulicella sp. 5B5]|uniref:anti-sigma factor family protein n=1 Tax=Granulicella sp. 5B5 TaxID=1617967 RepID=UPI0015F6FBE9|nr:zf-HC2 domain-containing protein [Granulicella sp. 5B5]QMV19122.1 anti-sigma factor [Granulicella sp. 5B5]